MTASVTPAALSAITTTTTTAPNTSTASTTPTTRSSSLVRTGAVAGVTAAVATTAIAALAHAAGVSFETAPGNGIPVAGFAQLTLLFSAVGVVLAAVLRRRASRPRRTFVRTTVVLTALSVVPDLAMPFNMVSKLTLVLTHVVAAAIVIPRLAERLPER
jgi:hypothetical protein